MELGATRLRFELSPGISLEAMLLNRGSGPLVVQYHGALDRTRYTPPRFERMATLKSLGHSSLIIADPTILLHERLQLAWYTGWSGVDLPAMLGTLVRSVAKALGAEKIFHVGASGGGFAALQVAPSTPGSTVLTMNPQTAINRYRVDDKFMGAQRTFVQHVFPSLWSERIEDLNWGSGWWHPMAERMSASHRYSLDQRVRIHFVQNMNDAHHVTHHYLPFLESIYSWISPEDLKVTEYDGPHAHVAPNDERYLSSLDSTLSW